MKPYVAPTVDSWMARVKENEQVLASLIRDYHPASRTVSVRPPLPITAQGAEAACEMVRHDIAIKEADALAPADRFTTAVQNNDVAEIVTLLNAAWFGVPESTGCWGIPGFSLAVDLIDDIPDGVELDE